ncbi:YggS family pyridoxal phosphate-dependent enzyme [uncultured Jatrophihabitans sp.]|uniref:YggS family pyridoxal phosphate-dependent enzyme n=1 Tax=uncultured Jatrophihabitans sp. TaxID=1610747 RepID=UPI0035CBDF00
MPANDPGTREAQIVSALGAVRARIAAACAAAGRDPRGVTLVAVTKTYPVTDVVALARLGVLDVGESKDQEARSKIAELGRQTDPPADLRWHLVGRLQTNKARSVVAYAHAVHSVDRLRLVHALAEAVEREGREPLEVFAQVSLDGDPARGGAPVADLDALVDAVAQRTQLRLRGLMAVPPMGTAADAEFGRLAELAAAVRARHPGADALSAGMSADLEAAIANGATHVRVGTALLGRRSPSFS